MGAVHGCYLKYVGLSLTSWAVASLVYGSPTDITRRDLTNSTGFGVGVGNNEPPLWRFLCGTALYYSASINGFIAVLFKARRFAWLLGKDSKRGTIPFWSYCIFAPFHVPTVLYTFVHCRQMKKKGIPFASEVCSGWYIGGRYSNLLRKHWSCVIDLTVEFPELCWSQTETYYHVPLWDGNPPSIEWIEAAARVATANKEKGKVLVHCAHGVGRSTTVMCACLVKAGEFKTWEEAFEAW
uniref:Tyrosine specific protein phosphatases domain-containing protein n=1 Tax=Corethron hystrix TaxID=216773 RepID=A0A7S1B8Z5_9STRA|mmetsp:Transcript_17432/g.39355  ORF Transcript_17432/g.39355 Transcript_17432/m.39355 type:complete len:239 (+) Transcript_17432:107-823(+)